MPLDTLYESGSEDGGDSSFAFELSNLSIESSSGTSSFFNNLDIDSIPSFTPDSSFEFQLDQVAVLEQNPKKEPSSPLHARAATTLKHRPSKILIPDPTLDFEAVTLPLSRSMPNLRTVNTWQANNSGESVYQPVSLNNSFAPSYQPVFSNEVEVSPLPIVPPPKLAPLQPVNSPYKRRSGRAKTFNMHKGFGFIVDDFGQEELNGHDVFVHHTAIQRVNNVENFKSLVKGEPVEYNIHIRVHDGKLGYLASDVTGPGGMPVCGDPHGRFGAFSKDAQPPGYPWPHGFRHMPPDLSFALNHYNHLISQSLGHPQQDYMLPPVPPNHFLLPPRSAHHPSTPLASPGVMEGFLISQPNADAQKFNLVVPPSASYRQPYFNMADSSFYPALPDQPKYVHHHYNQAPQYQQPFPGHFAHPNPSYAAYDAYYGKQEMPTYHQTPSGNLAGFEAHLDRVFTPPTNQYPVHEQTFPAMYPPYAQPLVYQPQTDLTHQRFQPLSNYFNKHHRSGSTASIMSTSSTSTCVPTQPDLRFPPGLGAAC